MMHSHDERRTLTFTWDRIAAGDKGRSLPNKFLKETHFSSENPTLSLCLVLW
jgi:hypothetical protein